MLHTFDVYESSLSLSFIQLMLSLLLALLLPVTILLAVIFITVFKIAAHVGHVSKCLVQIIFFFCAQLIPPTLSTHLAAKYHCSRMQRLILDCSISCNPYPISPVTASFVIPLFILIILLPPSHLPLSLILGPQPRGKYLIPLPLTFYHLPHSLFIRFFFGYSISAHSDLIITEMALVLW